LISCKNDDQADFNTEKYSAQLSKHADDYMMELKTVLIENMKKGGPIAAVHVCSDTAADLTNSYTEKMGVEVKRVSIKNRNPLNIPDEFELKALNTFRTLLADGALKPDTQILEKIKKNENTYVKFVKPILVDAPCLNCHGNETEISGVVKEVLTKKYPKDKAVNYKIGELRGAIAVTKEI
jgi:hypothetical protein